MENVVVKFSFPQTNTVFETGKTSQVHLEATGCYLKKTLEEVHDYLSSWHKDYQVQSVMSLKQLAHHTDLMAHDTTQYEVTVVLYKVMDKPFTEVFYKMSDHAIKRTLDGRRLESIHIQKVIHCMDYCFLPLSAITNFKDLN